MKILHKNILSIFVICFTSALFLAAIHHHDKKIFRINTCYLCKISNSLSFAVNKANNSGADFNFSTDHVSPLFISLPGCEIAIAILIAHFAIVLHSLSNKAPPFKS